MRKRIMSGSLCVLAVLAAGLYSGPAQAGSIAKNVILMISDGAGFNHFAAANYFDYGTANRPLYDSFPVQYGVATFEYGGSYDPAAAAADFNYVKSGYTDSASAATALYSGVKTVNGNIAWTPDDAPGGELKTIAEIAAERGKATGVVTSVQLSHATPAAVDAHNVSRNNYAQIANEMISSSDLDVIMGAGNPDYTDNGLFTTSKDYKYVGGPDTWTALKNGTTGEGWTLIETKQQFEDLASGALTAERVIGVPQVRSTLQQGRSFPSDAYLSKPLNLNVPSLATMTQGAINVLAQDLDGFFLMVEGGAVDWAGHANQKSRVVEEQQDFNAAVQLVVDWVEANGGWDENLLIVTADHETGMLWGEGANTADAYIGLQGNGVGYLPGMSFDSGDHTNSLVPLYARGAGSELFLSYQAGIDPRYGSYVDNTSVFHVMNAAVVPEPSTVVLLGLGSIGLVVTALRRRGR